MIMFVAWRNSLVFHDAVAVLPQAQSKEGEDTGKGEEEREEEKEERHEEDRNEEQVGKRVLLCLPHVRVRGA